ASARPAVWRRAWLRMGRPSVSIATVGRVRERPSGRGGDQLLEALEREVDARERRTEREPQVPAEARGAPTAPLARIDVEELARHRDDVALERGAEERHAVADRGRQV